MKLNFKLIFAFFAVFLLFILCSSNAQAAVHSTDDFSIDIPSTFKVNKNINYLEAESYDGQNMIMVQSADRDTQYIVSQNYNTNFNTYYDNNLVIKNVGGEKVKVKLEIDASLLLK